METKKPSCNRRKKATLIDYVQTFWPVALAMVAMAIFFVRSETVDNAAFNKLQTRVTVVEQKLPAKGSLIMIQQNQATMENQLKTLTKNVDRLLEMVHGKEHRRGDRGG